MTECQQPETKQPRKYDRAIEYVNSTLGEGKHTGKVRVPLRFLDDLLAQGHGIELAEEVIDRATWRAIAKTGSRVSAVQAQERIMPVLYAKKQPDLYCKIFA